MGSLSLYEETTHFIVVFDFYFLSFLFPTVNLGALVLRALFEHWPDANPLPASSENERDRTEEKGGEAKSGDQQSDTGTTGSGGQQSERSARRSEADGEQERSGESGVEGGGKREEEGKKDKKEQKKKENGGKQKKDKNKKSGKKNLFTH